MALQENQQQSSVEMAKELEQTKTTAISIEGEPHERGSTGGDSSQTTLPKFKPNYSMPMLAFKDGLKPNIALVQLLFDKATLLFTECSSSSSAIGEIHDLVEEIGNVLYCATRDIDMDNKEYTNTALVSAEKVMVSLEERLERLQQQTGLFFPDTSEKESLARTMPIRPEEAMPIEAASLPDVTEEAESIPPSVLNYPLEPMVDNSTLIGSIASFRQERPAEESVPAQPSDADSGREKGSKFSSNLKDAISDLGATLETNSSSALDATLKAMEPDTAPPAEQTSLESWLDATGVRYSASKETFNATKSSTGARGDVNVISDDDAKEAKTAASLKQDEPVPKSTPNMSAKMKSTPILDEAVWKEDVKSDLQALYELPSGSTAPDKTLWQASVDAGLRALHSPETEELRADSMTLKKTERKVSEAYDMTRPDSERLKNTDLEASDAIQKTEADPQKTQNMEQEVSDALSQAQSALDYADSAEVSIADQINSRMGGVVSKATDTVLDVTFRGAFFLASKALDAAFGRSKPKKKQTKKPVSKRGAKDIPAPKKDKSEQDAAVPFFATVKKTEEKAASSRLFSPQPPVSPPPLNSTIGHGDKTTLPGTNFSSSSGSGISPNKNSSPPDALGDVGAFESSSNIGGMSPALQGFLKRFGPKSSLFPLPQENDDDDQEPRSRDDLLPSTTLFYHSHTLSPRLSTRKMLSRALLGSRSDTLSKNKRHPLMSTIIGALVYPFLLRRVEPSLLVAAVLLQCFLLLRNSARS